MDTNEGKKRHSTARTYPHKVVVYEDDEGLGLLEALAKEWGCSQAAAVRRMVRKTAREEGLRPVA